MSYQFKTIGLVIRNDIESYIDSVWQVADMLAQRADVLVHCLDFDQPAAQFDETSMSTLVEDADLVITLGGDGTLLSAARMLVDKNTPLLGINFGRLGFLADVSFEEFESYVKQVLDGHYSTESRFFVKGEFYEDDELISSGIALNDIFLHSHQSFKMIEYEVYSGGKLIHRQRSDGVIVTTPTGSTAYALSGGGPIMHPSLETLAIVPICPHTLSNRPIVLPADQPIEFKLTDETATAGVSYDGQNTLSMDGHNKMRVTRYPQPLTLLHPEDYDYFEILRKKLYWSTNY